MMDPEEEERAADREADAARQHQENEEMHRRHANEEREAQARTDEAEPS